MRHTILVVGATGILGEPVARQLQKDGYSVRVLTRNPERARTKLGGSFDFIRGDVLDISSLERAIEGCFGIHISLRGGPGAKDFERVEHHGTANIAKVSIKAGVKHLTYLSGAAVFEEYSFYHIVRGKLQAESAIRESGVPYTIFCATHFMESLSRFIRGGRAVIVGRQPHPLHWLAAGDYARMVSKAFQIAEAKNKRFFVFGPEALTTLEALRTYCSIVHPGVKIYSMPIWLFTAICTVSLNAELKFIAELMRFFEDVGEGKGNPGEANRLLGKPTTTLKQWCNERRSAA